MTYRVTLIPGDGIGPEITAATLQVLDATGIALAWDQQTPVTVAVERRGEAAPDPVIESIRGTGVALKGPLATPVGSGHRSINVALRRAFDLYANVRPVKTIIPGTCYEDIDLVMVRENTEGLYVGVEHFVAIGDDPRAVAESSAIVTRKGCERIIRFAFEYALKHGRRLVTVVHKANILKMASGLFLEVGRDVAQEYEGRVAFNDRIVDNAAMQLVLHPQQFDVIVTTNMFGDILSDEMAGLVGGLGLAPGANIGSRAAIFEAVHGTAPDIAGRGVANPGAMMLSAAMLLDYLGETGAAECVKGAVIRAIRDDEVRTRDLGGEATTTEFANHVAKLVRSQ
jgi:isocitrate dehydrogenase (NAD+)